MNPTHRALLLGLALHAGVALTAAAPVDPVREFQVEYRRPFKNESGRLRFDEAGVHYHGTRVLDWDYGEIQQIRLGRQTIQLHSYEDSKWRLGRDKVYSFKLLEGEVDAQLAAQLRETVSGILVSSLDDQWASPLFRFPVKRVRGWFGEEGVLEIGEQGIRYQSSQPDRSRSWGFEQISSFAQPSRREFELVAEEVGMGGSHRTFRFQLKAPLPASIYDFLWPRIHSAISYPVAAPERPR